MNVDSDPLWSVYCLYNDKWLLRASDHPTTKMSHGLYMWHEEFKTVFTSIECIMRYALDMDINLQSTMFVPVYPAHNGPGPRYEPDFQEIRFYHQDYLEEQFEREAKYR